MVSIAEGILVVNAVFRKVNMPRVMGCSFGMDSLFLLASMVLMLRDKRSKNALYVVLDMRPLSSMYLRRPSSPSKEGNNAADTFKCVLSNNPKGTLIQRPLYRKE